MLELICKSAQTGQDKKPKDVIRYECLDNRHAAERVYGLLKTKNITPRVKEFMIGFIKNIFDKHAAFEIMGNTYQMRETPDEQL